MGGEGPSRPGSDCRPEGGGRLSRCSVRTAQSPLSPREDQDPHQARQADVVSSPHLQRGVVRINPLSGVGRPQASWVQRAVSGAGNPTCTPGVDGWREGQ